MRRSTHALVRCALERNSYDVMKLVDADHGDSPKGGDELLHVCRRMTPPVVCRGRRKSRRRAAAAAAAIASRRWRSTRSADDRKRRRRFDRVMSCREARPRAGVSHAPRVRAGTV